MKLTKKLLLAGLAITCLSLVGCPKDIGASGIIDGGGMGWDAGVEYTNETEDVVRSLKRTKQQHSGGLYTVHQDVHDDVQDGMLGVVFGLKENSKGLYDFFVVGTSIQSGKERGYISYFVNIASENFSESNFGVTSGHKKTSMSAMRTISDDSTNTTPYEYEITSLPANAGSNSTIITSNLDKVYDSTSKEYEVKIAIYPEFSDSDNQYTGNYIVRFYAGDVKLAKVTNSTTGKQHHEPQGENITQLYTKTISDVFDVNYLVTNSKNTQNNDAQDKADYNNLPQGELGYYCNVYTPTRTLSGKWKLTDTVNEVVEE